MAMSWLSSLGLLVCLSYLPEIDACTCIFNVPQGYYCANDLVIRITVTGPEQVVIREGSDVMRPATPEEEQNNQDHQGDMYRRYPYTADKVYKGRSPNSDYVYSVYHSNLCGMQLSTGTFLAMGSSQRLGGKRSMDLDACGYETSWTDVNKRTRKQLKNNKFDMCDCEIEQCFSSGCSAGPSSSEDACPLYAFGDAESFCYTKSVCKRNGKGTCSWKKTWGFKQCKRDL